jgi:hypothetical protein
MTTEDYVSFEIVKVTHFILDEESKVRILVGQLD